MVLVLYFVFFVLYCMVLSYILCFCLVGGGSMTPVRARARALERQLFNRHLQLIKLAGDEGGPGPDPHWGHTASDN